MRVCGSFERCSWVDGEPTPGSDRSFYCINPANVEDQLGPYQAAMDADYERAVLAATRAVTKWSGTPTGARAELLTRVAEMIRTHQEDIARALTREEGKTLAEARAEALAAAAVLDYTAGNALWNEGGRVVASARTGAPIYTRRYPLGVVGVITPWNFPIANPAAKIGSALMAGNTVIWKPSPWAPATALALTRCLHAAGLAAGVVNTLIDDSPRIGMRLVEDERIAAITFTGSSETGHRIRAAAAVRGVPVQLEMGGKNAVVVLKDASLREAARAVAEGAFMSAGQRCTAVSRVIVEEAIGGAFLAELRSATEAMVLGDPMDPKTQIPPVVHDRQLARQLGAIEQARAEGVTVLQGGARRGGALSRGYFLQPTILQPGRPDCTIAQAELFGPILCFLLARDYEQAAALANMTRYGLAASIFTRDLATAMDFAENCDAGTVKVNETPPGGNLNVPVGGWKDSGFGLRELGPRSLEFFSREKTVYLNPSLA